MAGTIILHASLSSPEETINIKLWPIWKNNEVWIYKHIPNPCTQLYPIELWYHSIFNPFSETFPVAVNGYIQPICLSIRPISPVPRYKDGPEVSNK